MPFVTVAVHSSILMILQLGVVERFRQLPTTGVKRLPIRFPGNSPFPDQREYCRIGTDQPRDPLGTGTPPVVTDTRDRGCR